MSNEIRETVFRIMTVARVFNRKSDGVITQMFIDESTVGTLPQDKLTGQQVAFINRNAEALGLSAAMCLLQIAQAKTDEAKAAAAKMTFDGGADQQAATEARTVAADIIRQATDGAIPSREPGPVLVPDIAVPAPKPLLTPRRHLHELDKDGFCDLCNHTWRSHKVTPVVDGWAVCPGQEVG